MRNFKITAMVIIATGLFSLTLMGCPTRETRITTGTERTERVIDEQFVDPGDQETGDPQTRTETRERVIEEGPVVK